MNDGLGSKGFTGMPQVMARQFGCKDLSLNTAVGTTDELDMRSAAGGTVQIPSGSSITSLTYYAATEPGGTYSALYTDSGTAVTQTVAADRVYDMPSAVAACGAVKIVANAAGAVKVTLKG